MADRTPQQFKDIGKSLKFNLENGHLLASVILTYSYINAMASLIMPVNQEKVKGKDFINWVDNYMKADKNQPYQYKGIDLWGARCGLVHRYSPYSNLSKNGKCKILNYHNGSEHIYHKRNNEGDILLSVHRLVNDFFKAMSRFLSDLMKNETLRRKADERFKNHFFQIKKARKKGG